MTPERAREVLAEAARRRSPSPVRLSAFPKQRAFLDDKCRIKAALCTRRSGKSFGAAIELFDGALTFPGTSQLYVSLTRESARRIMHKDVMKVINRTFGLGAVFNETTLEVKFPNGSVIYLLGADAKPDEADKILGQKFKRAVIDECASFRQSLKHLVYGVIRPTLTDLEGTLSLIGTPGNFKNFFYDITSGLEPGWSVHQWSAHENPHVSAQFAQEIAEMVAVNPSIVDTPLFKQHYLGEWTVDPSKLVYKYDRARNWTPEAPSLEGAHVVLVLDLGYNDATAVTICAYVDGNPTLYILESHKRAELTVSQVATWVRGFMDRYAIEQFVVDPASKQVVEELRQRYHLPLESAEKSGKVEAIAMMNSDFLTGRIKLVGDACEALETEYAELVWDERAPRPTENQACKNDCLVAGTMVKTSTGEVPIERVRVGDMVLTRNGMRSVTSSEWTGSRETWELESESGATIRATGNHPVFANNTWVPLAELMPGCTLLEWGSTGQTKLSCIEGYGTEDTQSLRIGIFENITKIANIGAFTVWFGPSISGQSRRNTASTIKTETRRIIVSAISSLWLSARTRVCMGRWIDVPQNLVRCWTRSAILRPLGTVLQRGARGILRTAERLLQLALSEPVFASFAVAGLSPLSLLQRFARATATKSGASPLESTTLTPRAQSARVCLGPTNTNLPSVAPSRVRRVSKTGSVENVYNLSVEGDPEYFANGILVHNCSDSALYGWRAALNYATPTVTKAPPRDAEAVVDAWWDQEERKAQKAAAKPFWEDD